MRVLAVAGTLAMFLVGGGIVTHNLPAVHHAVHDWIASLVDRAGLPEVAATVGGKIFDLLAGVLVGLAGVALMASLNAIRRELIRPASVPGEEQP
jgi:predicted DNA repair protein MutK